MQNSVLAQVGTIPSDTMAAEGGSNFFSSGEPITSSHQKHSETVIAQNVSVSVVEWLFRLFCQLRNACFLS